MLRKTTIIVEAIELSRRDSQELWAMSCEDRNKNYDVEDWETSDGRNCIRMVGEDFYREVILPKARASKELVVRELRNQEGRVSEGCNLCIRITGGFVDIVSTKYGWRVDVLNDSRGIWPTRKLAIDFLEKSKNIFEEPPAVRPAWC